MGVATFTMTLIRTISTNDSSAGRYQRGAAITSGTARPTQPEATATRGHVLFIQEKDKSLP